MSADEGLDARAAAFTSSGYRYTVVTIANGLIPNTMEAELWYGPPSGEKWTYFRRAVADTAEGAARRVEAEFKEWADGQLEANA